MIHVSQKKLDKSYRHLKQECKKNHTDSNAKLLLFIYAIECGIKALLLKRKNMADTFVLQNNEGTANLTHDLQALLCNLHAPYRFSSDFKFLTRSKTPETVPVKDLHQALRYGGTFYNREDKDKLKKKLDQIDSWLQEALTR
ncbi:hypothetical protein MTBBW1_410072 [Desulfamplus magnetovallimortis]|uniref:HEPN domain-containing protein n=1 Tax=Desulfamplus magnetovallimortis TaxID=1246637 RepID=A0A1W1HGU0_9BACT|nr:hypothetical protein [Desulfamplus magnetovallimortis]SLM31717.1 hypothetical protein MTBBW1_410072 [Desulfamplus magnetovallimortis]